MRIIPWATRFATTPISLSSISGRGGGISSVLRSASTPVNMSAPQPTWSRLLSEGIARHKRDPTAKFCQLATAAVGGGASCRTWVFRGFWEDSGALKFITDRRSQKIPEIAADPAGEVCFYLTKTREQFRIKGRLEVIGCDESDERLAKARKSQWKQISPSSQASFATSLIPGLPKREEEEMEENKVGTGDGDPDPPEEPCDDFCLVLFWPHFVDHLVLKDGQTRHVHKLFGAKDGGGVPLAGKSVEAIEGEVEQESGARQPLEWKTLTVNP